MLLRVAKLIDRLYELLNNYCNHCSPALLLKVVPAVNLCIDCTVRHAGQVSDGTQ